MNAKTTSTAEEATTSAFYTTIETARLLGLAVRSVQLMVDRGELEAWKTPGGHRRISKVSVERWIAVNRMNVSSGSTGGTGRPESRAPRVLLVEDSSHFQNLVSLLVREQYPEVELHVADDGIAGLAMYGQLQPQVLIVDILLPGIDGATLITGLRSRGLLHRSAAGTAMARGSVLDSGLAVATYEHFTLVLISLLLSCLLGVPLGIIAFEYRKLGQVLVAATGLSSVGQDMARAAYGETFAAVEESPGAASDLILDGSALRGTGDENSMRIGRIGRQSLRAFTRSQVKLAVKGGRTR